MATGPLRNTEKQYISKHKEKGAEFLSKKLSRRIETVEKYLETLNVEVEKEVKKKQKEENIVDNLFAKRKDRGVVVMTEAASSYLDGTKTRKRKSIFDLPYVHKIKPDE